MASSTGMLTEIGIEEAGAFPCTTEGATGLFSTTFPTGALGGTGGSDESSTTRSASGGTSSSRIVAAGAAGSVTAGAGSTSMSTKENQNKLNSKNMKL